MPKRFLEKIGKNSEMSTVLMAFANNRTLRTAWRTSAIDIGPDTPSLKKLTIICGNCVRRGCLPFCIGRCWLSLCVYGCLWYS